MKTKSLHRQSGLNLVEILVAALILSIGLLSLAGLQVASLKSVHNASQKQQASFMIHELLERMRSNRPAVINGDYAVEDFSCTSGTAPTDCGATATCTSAAMAAYDLYTIQCGSNSATAIDSGINDQLLNADLTVACLPAGCDPATDPDAGMSITLSWTERLASSDLVEEDEDGNNQGIEQEDFTLSVNLAL